MVTIHTAPPINCIFVHYFHCISFTNCFMIIIKHCSSVNLYCYKERRAAYFAFTIHMMCTFFYFYLLQYGQINKYAVLVHTVKPPHYYYHEHSSFIIISVTIDLLPHYITYHKDHKLQLESHSDSLVAKLLYFSLPIK